MDQSQPITDEALLRNEVAVCTRTLNNQGILGYSGHITARLSDPEQFLIQSFDQPRSAVTPTDLLRVAIDGTPIEAPVGRRPPDEVFIHTEVLRARPDVKAVAHFHPDVATLFTLVDGVELKPVKNHAARWASGIPVHPEASKIIDPAMGQAVASSLGAHQAVLLRAHGVVIVAESVPALMIDCIHFVENADTMYKAAMLGPVTPLSAEEMAEVERHTNRDAHNRKLWDYYIDIALGDGAIQADWL